MKAHISFRRPHERVYQPFEKYVIAISKVGRIARTVVLYHNKYHEKMLAIFSSNSAQRQEEERVGEGEGSLYVFWH